MIRLKYLGTPWIWQNLKSHEWEFGFDYVATELRDVKQGKLM